MDSQFTLNRKEYNDSDKLSQLSFKEVKYMYYRTKEENKDLKKSKHNFEAHYKKELEHMEL